MMFAAAGVLPPVAGAIIQEIIDVAAVLNALRASWSPPLVDRLFRLDLSLRRSRPRQHPPNRVLGSSLLSLLSGQWVAIGIELEPE